jgi:hypothetical protein
MKRGWFAIAPLALIVAGQASSTNLEAGTWMLDVYRPDAPQDTIRLEISFEDGVYAVTLSDGASTQVEDLRMADGDVWFEHRDLRESCRLRPTAEPDVWEGTCPPDNEPRFDGGLTVSLRPPRGGDDDAPADPAGESLSGETPDAPAMGEDASDGGAAEEEGASGDS